MWGKAVIGGFGAALAQKFHLLVPGLWLVGALLLGAVVIALIKHWRGRAGSERLSPGDQLAQFRSLYEKGAISAEEFERLRAMLGDRMRQALDLPPPAETRKAVPETRITPAPTDVPRPPEPPDEGIRPA